jgi:hypothetical protein
MKGSAVNDDPDVSGGDHLPVLAHPLPEEATLEDKLERGVQLRSIGGYTWREVARICGYPSAEAAQMSISTALERQALELSQDKRQRILAMEVDRYERIHAAYMPSALEGDHKSAEIVLKTAAQRQRLLALGEEATSQKTYQTIIIPSENMAEEMRRIVEEDDD